MNDAFKLMILVNTKTPYTTRLFSAIASRTALSLEVVYCSKHHRNRPQSWGELNPDFAAKYLWGFHLYLRGSSKDPLHFNPSIAYAIRKGRPDVCVLYGYSDLTNLIAVMTSRIAGIPYVLEIDGWNLKPHPKFIRPLIQWIIRGAAAHIIAGENARLLLSSYSVEPNLVYRVPCVTDLSSFHDISKKLRSSTDWQSPSMRAERGRFVLFVGRLVEEKGIVDLMKSFGRLRLTDPRLSLVVLGRGPLEAELREIAGEIGNVEFLDYVTEGELARLYAESSVVVLPSHSEPFGIVAVEAFVSGAPVVMSDRCGSVQCLPRSSWVGYIKPGDVDALVQAMRRAIHLSDSQERDIDDPEILQVLKENSDETLVGTFLKAVRDGLSK